ncbi:LamG-like jellyroll fold domain-containing protein [Flavobacterium crassostreae]|uniref:LamG-like jellyroll fold domain-containing protein n=1 Tax=Flavobacterium crassostreae TaxID=1763534 RepID=A0A1B9E089_9FLAO|nr:LamG-like jellyroll fold domain-containing protein [Flavobacterium crassostreae]OCB75351.1 hypothetical protein LPBF_08125 [Flavobacterium crassostreae]
MKRIILLLLVFLLLPIFSIGQNASSYCFTAASSTYVPLTSATNVLGMSATDDDKVSDLTPLPFGFVFAGQTYFQFAVSSNGWLSFVNPAITNLQNYANSIGNASSIKPALLPLWDDLKNGTIPRYAVSGTAPNRIFKIEWSQQRWNYLSNNDVISFQVWLYETTNVIEYNYKQGASAISGTATATIGIYDVADTYLTLDNSGVAPAASSSTFITSIGAKPASDQLYRFTPSKPASVTIAASPSGTICTGGLVTFTATPTNGGTAPTYQWKVGTTNVGSGGSVFSSATLVKGDVVSCVMTSNASPCLTGSPATSNAVTMDVRPPLPALTAAITGAGCSSNDGAISITNGNSALEFLQADNDYVDLNAPILSGRKAFAMEGWIKYKSSDIPGGLTSLFGQNDAIEFGFSGTRFHLWTPRGNTYVNIPAGLGDDNWHHIVAMGDGTNIKIYADGVLLVTQAAGVGTSDYGSSTFSTKVGSGVFNATGNTFTGQIMKVGIYNRALLPAEIINLASSPTNYTAATSGLIAGYNLYEGAGTTLASVPAGTNATLVNTPVWKDPCTYSWAKTGDAAFVRTTKNISGLTTGSYTLTVSLAGVGCPTATTFTVSAAATTWNGSAWSNGTPTASKKMVFAGNYPNTINTDLEGCSCEVANGVAVTIKGGRYMRVQNEVVVLGTGTLTFEDKASLIQVQDLLSTPNSGIITYKRRTNLIDKFDYTYWSSPVKNQKLIAVSPTTLGDKFLSFDAAANNWKYEDSYNTNMIPAKGYIIRGPQEFYAPNPPTGIHEASFIGEPINGPVTIAIEGTAVYNLIGNPYPSALDANAFLSANSTVLQGTIYFWTHNTDIGIGVSNPGTGTYAYSSDDYATYNLTGGTATRAAAPSATNPGAINTAAPTGEIAAGQSFFAVSTAPGNAIFNNAMRTKSGVVLSNSQFFRPSLNSQKVVSLEKNRIWLNLTNAQGAFKQILVGYVSGATNNYDNAYDGANFNANAFINFYSLQDDLDLSIQGRALPFDEKDTVSLGYESNIAGDFQIALDQKDGIFDNKSVFLEDRVLNSIHNLTQDPYHFATEAGVFKERFVLRYTNKTLQTDAFELPNTGVVIVSKNKEISIESLDGKLIDKVLVYDFSGKQLYSKTKVDASRVQLLNLTAIDTVLIVKVLLQNGQTITQKIRY